MIEVVHVTHHYGIRPVLKDISLQADRGEILALMGPNGMGKSTLLAVIAGALWPVIGRVKIDGKWRRATPEDELAIRRQVVYLPAEPWLPKDRTGREWLLAVGRLYSIPETRLMDHVPRLLSLFDLETKGDEPIIAYSTGQKKKIALAGAIVTEAPVMLLDEPFAGGLDPSGILALKRIFQKHREDRDATVIMATPVPELVEDIADRIAIIRDGELIACDTLAGLQRQSGKSGSLAEVYDSLVNMGSNSKIDQYFGGSR